MNEVTIFAPSPTLTVTVEDHPQGSEIHVHAGGQGVWQARMLRRLQIPVTMCCVLIGEVGRVLRHLLEDDEGVTVVPVNKDGRGSAYLHDRRDGKRVIVAEDEGDPLGRHELDDLYSAALRSGSESRLVILSGPTGDATLPADVYRRLTADLRRQGTTVLADLSGERLRAVVDGGVDVLKVSHEELLDDGLVSEATVPEIIEAMQSLRRQGAGAVIVTRASDPALLADDRGVVEVTLPPFEAKETRGAGDSLAAGVAAGLAQGESLRKAITLGVAAGALNVTRHGLGTGDGDAISRLRDSVRVREIGASDGDAPAEESRVTPDDLAALASQEEES